VNSSLRQAQWLALGVPALLLAGAYVSQYGFGLFPCQMCWWQRYAHFAAVLPALVAFMARPKQPWIALAALAVLASGLIGAFHAGVEYGWWEGLTTCTTTGATSLDDIMAVPLVRCDQVQWSLAGVSLAGFNAIFSLGGALAIAILARRKAS
jgi:disulfide bond formation protein DsbB